MSLTHLESIRTIFSIRPIMHWNRINCGEVMENNRRKVR